MKTFPRRPLLLLNNISVLPLDPLTKRTINYSVLCHKKNVYTWSWDFKINEYFSKIEVSGFLLDCLWYWRSSFFTLDGDLDLESLRTMPNSIKDNRRTETHQTIPSLMGVFSCINCSISFFVIQRKIILLGGGDA